VGNKGRIEVSIIVVNYNTRDILRDCLDSVYKQAKIIECEVIVIDNASRDGSVEMIKNFFPQVILIENPINRGFAAANNQGIRVAKGEYMLLLNSDTILLDNAVKKSVEFADSHERAGIVGCRVLNRDGTLQPTCFMFPSLLNLVLLVSCLNKLFYRSRFFGREQMTWWDRMDEREVDVVTGCFMLVRREGVRDVGLLDEQYFMYGEETDWCYRFKKKNWKVFYTPVPEIVHIGGCSSSHIKPKMILQLRGSILLFFKKHYGQMSYRLACFLTSCFFLCRMPYWFGRALFSGGFRKPYLEMAVAYWIGAFKAVFGWQALCAWKLDAGD
jgi:GT2 family glycosyltransferase